MRDTTLCFLVRGDEVLLGMKKRGFGQGKWNGIGGKPDDGEGVKEAAVRELAEEICVNAKVEDLESCGYLDFYFPTKKDWNQRVHLFCLNSWDGEPKETEEMAPSWHSKDALPYEAMWVDDPHWLPRVLSGEKIEAEFHFAADDGKEIRDFEIRSF